MRDERDAFDRRIYVSSHTYEKVCEVAADDLLPFVVFFKDLALDVVEERVDPVLHIRIQGGVGYVWIFVEETVAIIVFVWVDYLSRKPVGEVEADLTDGQAVVFRQKKITVRNAWWNDTYITLGAGDLLVKDGMYSASRYNKTYIKGVA